MIDRRALILGSGLFATAAGAQAWRPWRRVNGSPGLQFLAKSQLWTPAQLGSAVSVWFDASAQSTLSLSGSNVSSWASLVNGVTASPASGRNPTFSTTARNGLPGLLFSGAQAGQELVLSGLATAPTGSAAGGFFGVGYWNSASVPANGAAFTGYGTASSNSWRVLQITDSPSGNVKISYFGDDYATSFSWSQQDRFVYTDVSAGANPVTSLTVNGGTVATKSSTTTLTTAASSGVIGIDPSQGGYSWNGVIQEVLWFNRQLTVTERQKLEGYAAWKWGQQANLPSNHPYKNAAP